MMRWGTSEPRKTLATYSQINYGEDFDRKKNASEAIRNEDCETGTTENLEYYFENVSERETGEGWEVKMEVPIKPYYQDEHCTLYNAHCRHVLPFLDKFDLLLTDPPYGLGSRLTGGDGEWGTHFKKSPQWDAVTSPDWLILQAIATCELAIVWGGNYYKLPPARCWLSWDKMQEHTSGHFEMAWTTLDKPTRTFRMSRVEAHSDGKLHPTEKPIGLFRWCLSLVPDAKTILDPFAGSGTTLVAAKLEGRKAVGVEIDEKYCEIAANRLRQKVLF